MTAKENIMGYLDNANERTISFNALGCDGLTEKKFSAIPKERIRTITRQCEDVYNEGLFSCKHPQREEYFEEAKGFDLHTKNVLGTRFDDLPFYIPVPDRRTAKLPLTLHNKTLGVRIEDMYPYAVRSYEGSLRYSSARSVNNSHIFNSVYESSKNILFYSGPDTLIEGLNREKKKYGIYETLSSADFAGVTTPDFSVNTQSCYVGQVTNINRSLAIGEEMEAFGIPVIPNVYAADEYQIALWSDYLNQNKDIGVISINCQLQRRKKMDVFMMIHSVIELLKRVMHEIHIILRGFPFEAEYLLMLKDYACRLHFADSAPFFGPRNNFYQVYEPGVSSPKRVQYKSTDPNTQAKMIEMSVVAREQFLYNLLYRNSVCHDFARSSLVAGI